MNEYIELLKSLVAIPRESGKEKVASDFLQKWMEDRGLEVKRLHNNLWVESEPESGKPTLLLNAHIDTVKPSAGYTRDPYLPSCEGDRIYGLGTNDDGASLVSLLAAYMELSSKPQPCRMVFSATCEEENCGPQGIETVIDKFGKVSLGIIGEPTGMNMALAEKGLMVLDCTAKGRSGHAAREEGDNALYKALDDINWVRTFKFPKISEFLGPVKMTATIIQAGTVHNVVPDICRFTLDVRSNGEYSNAEILDIIRTNLKSEVVPRSMKHNSSSISKDNPVVRKGFEMGLEAFGSPTTSNQTRCCFPTFKIGPGDSSRSHCADEFIKESEIMNAIEIYIKLLDNYGDIVE